MTKRTLAEIETEYKQVIELKEPVRTTKLVNLMNELEQGHNAFIINPSAAEQGSESVKLYHEISLARKI